MRTLIVASLLSWGMISGLSYDAKAESQPPEKLTEAIFEIEDAANDKDIDKLLEYYSDDFTNTDGLSIETLANSLEEMWENYSQLTYITEIESWSEEDGLLVAETLTQIQGTQEEGSRVTNLDSTIRSRQYFKDSKLVNQEILSEQSR
ncbi:MAG: nuclear transport factor 2 family protein, partial [Cyanobacteria bacterium P01_G01_bin.19]